MEFKKGFKRWYWFSVGAQTAQSAHTQTPEWKEMLSSALNPDITLFFSFQLQEAENRNFRKIELEEDKTSHSAPITSLIAK